MCVDSYIDIWPVGVAVNIPDFQSGDEEFESPTGYKIIKYSLISFGMFCDCRGKVRCQSSQKLVASLTTGVLVKGSLKTPVCLFNSVGQSISFTRRESGVRIPQQAQ